MYHLDHLVQTWPDFCTSFKGGLNKTLVAWSIFQNIQKQNLSHISLHYISLGLIYNKQYNIEAYLATSNKTTDISIDITRETEIPVVVRAVVEQNVELFRWIIHWNWWIIHWIIHQFPIPAMIRLYIKIKGSSFKWKGTSSHPASI